MADSNKGNQDNGENSDGFVSNGNGVFATSQGDTTGDYSTWSWKVIEAAITGGAAYDGRDGGSGYVQVPSDPQTLQDAADSLYYAQCVLQEVAQAIADQTNALTGEDGPWQGAAAQAFNSTMSRVAKQAKGLADVLSGGVTGDYNVPQKLADNAKHLSDAIYKIRDIDLWYANQAVAVWQAAHPLGTFQHDAIYVNNDPHGLVAIHKVPQAQQMMTNDMRQVLVTLASQYELSKDSIRQPASPTNPNSAPPPGYGPGQDPNVYGPGNYNPYSGNNPYDYQEGNPYDINGYGSGNDGNDTYGNDNNYDSGNDGSGAGDNGNDYGIGGPNGLGSGGPIQAYKDGGGPDDSGAGGLGNSPGGLNLGGTDGPGGTSGSGNSPQLAYRDLPAPWDLGGTNSPANGPSIKSVVPSGIAPDSPDSGSLADTNAPFLPSDVAPDSYPDGTSLDQNGPALDPAMDAALNPDTAGVGITSYPGLGLGPDTSGGSTGGSKKAVTPYGHDTSLTDPAGEDVTPYTDTGLPGLDTSGISAPDGSGLGSAASYPDTSLAGDPAGIADSHAPDLTTSGLPTDGSLASYPDAGQAGADGALSGPGGMPMMPMGGMGGMGAGQGAGGGPGRSDASGLLNGDAAPWSGLSPDGLGELAGGVDAGGPGLQLDHVDTVLPNADGSLAGFPGGATHEPLAGFPSGTGGETAASYLGDGQVGADGAGSALGGMPMMPMGGMGGMGAGQGAGGGPGRSDASGLLNGDATPWSGEHQTMDGTGDITGGADAGGPGLHLADAPATAGAPPQAEGHQAAPDEQATSQAPLAGSAPPGAAVASDGTPMMPMGGMGAGAGGDRNERRSDASGFLSGTSEPWAVTSDGSDGNDHAVGSPYGASRDRARLRMPDEGADTQAQAAAPAENGDGPLEWEAFLAAAGAVGAVGAAAAARTHTAEPEERFTDRRTGHGDGAVTWSNGAWDEESWGAAGHDGAGQEPAHAAEPTASAAPVGEPVVAADPATTGGPATVAAPTALADVTEAGPAAPAGPGTGGGPAGPTDPWTTSVFGTTTGAGAPPAPEPAFAGGPTALGGQAATADSGAMDTTGAAATGGPATPGGPAFRMASVGPGEPMASGTSAAAAGGVPEEHAAFDVRRPETVAAALAGPPATAQEPGLAGHVEAAKRPQVREVAGPAGHRAQEAVRAAAAPPPAAEPAHVVAAAHPEGDAADDASSWDASGDSLLPLLGRRPGAADHSQASDLDRQNAAAATAVAAGAAAIARNLPGDREFAEPARAAWRPKASSSGPMRRDLSCSFADVPQEPEPEPEESSAGPDGETREEWAEARRKRPRNRRSALRDEDGEDTSSFADLLRQGEDVWG